MDYIKEAEKYLWYYNDLKRSIDIMSREISKIVAHSGPKSVTAMMMDSSGVRSGKHDEAINVVLKIQTLQDNIENTQSKLDEVNNILEEISKEKGCENYGKVLKMWYIERLPKEEIADKLNYSSKQTIYDIQHVSIRKFAVMILGVGALQAV